MMAHAVAVTRQRQKDSGYPTEHGEASRCDRHAISVIDGTNRISPSHEEWSPDQDEILGKAPGVLNCPTADGCGWRQWEEPRELNGPRRLN